MSRFILLRDNQTKIFTASGFHLVKEVLRFQLYMFTTSVNIWAVSQTPKAPRRSTGEIKNIKMGRVRQWSGRELLLEQVPHAAGLLSVYRITHTE